MVKLIVLLLVLGLVLSVLARINRRRVVGRGKPAPSLVPAVHYLERPRDGYVVTYERPNEVTVLSHVEPAPLVRVPRHAPFSRWRIPDDGLALTGHTLLLGQSGGGKSNAVMLQLLRRIEAGHWITVIDTKGEITPIFESLVACAPLQDAALVFEAMTVAARERQELFARTAKEYGELVRNIDEYQSVTGERLHHITLVVEELVMTMGAVKEKDLVGLLVAGRSAGVWVLAVSQYLNATILSKKGSINFHQKAYVGAWDSVSARLVFPAADTKQLAEFRKFVGPPGRAAIQDADGYRVEQLPLVPDAMLRSVLRGEW